jgi:hypothetical protein
VVQVLVAVVAVVAVVVVVKGLVKAIHSPVATPGTTMHITRADTSLILFQTSAWPTGTITTGSGSLGAKPYKMDS